MLLMIDNYDSFTYNIVQYFQCLGQEVMTVTHDGITIEEIATLRPDYLVISPGPNSPAEAGISLAVIQHFYQQIPILGICLGHQCLGQAFGASIIQAPEILHGKTSPIIHNRQRLFNQIPSPFLATRYHSLAIDPHTLPICFNIDAWASVIVSPAPAPASASPPHPNPLPQGGEGIRSGEAVTNADAWASVIVSPASASPPHPNPLPQGGEGIRSGEAVTNAEAGAYQTIMAISHREYPLYGVQFHPEAILTEHGMTLLRNFCHFSRLRATAVPS